MDDHVHETVTHTTANNTPANAYGVIVTLSPAYGPLGATMDATVFALPAELNDAAATAIDQGGYTDDMELVAHMVEVVDTHFPPRTREGETPPIAVIADGKTATHTKTWGRFFHQVNTPDPGDPASFPVEMEYFVALCKLHLN